VIDGQGEGSAHLGLDESNNVEGGVWQSCARLKDGVEFEYASVLSEGSLREKRSASTSAAEGCSFRSECCG
jgi:hypothetical protein